MNAATPIALGCMRLSTDPARDEGTAIAVLHAAFDAGISLLDTADAYCRDDSETGHNERLIARALASWNGDSARVRVATKGGLTRPDGRWVADGRARHFISACDASRRALGVDRIHLYQLHAVDPRTPLATSVRALDSLKRDGHIEQIGLSNVTVGQIEEARRLTEISSVQVELSLWQHANLLNGVVEYCLAHNIQLLAYRPLGGGQRRRRSPADPLLAELAARYAATPAEMALAWLTSLSDLVIPIPGATRVETVSSIARARQVVFSEDERAQLDERFPVRRLIHARGTHRAPNAVPVREGEVVLIMGLPGAGKSTVALTFVERGYERLNRDESGGSLNDVAAALDRKLAAGSSRIVLDNTYVSRASRAAVTQAARRHGLPVRCVWLATTIEDSQVNAVSRIVSRYGRLLTPEEMARARKRDIAAFGPAVQFRYQRELEAPDPAEEFSQIDVAPFARRRDPSFINRALIIWCEGVLYRSRSGGDRVMSADDVELVPGCGDALRQYHADGWRLLGLSWQPGVAERTLTPAGVDEILTRVRELLGVAIEIDYCPHAAGPPVCWCRKPLPGLGVVFIERHRLDAEQCVYVGASAQDPLFARRLGFRYRDAGEFFSQ